ncbi:MAG: tetratricopeptide repeat protein [Sedimentisphaerales bacterium]|nr:tetratricopeptide repeat protein [Sedimentisphaerales bacterium]
MAHQSHSKYGFLIEGFFPGLLVIVGLIAYSNSFGGPFIFDDVPNIVENPAIRQLWPPTHFFSLPTRSGLAGRPVLTLSFALNYAFCKYNVWGYHLVNLAIHILAALALYGIVRRTFLSGRLKEKFGSAAASLAFVTAAIWLVHPIQTESVTYIVQRAESLAGLFYLLTVYTAIRSMQPNRSILWPVLSVVFCALGMTTKEVMATAPVLILLYDRTFSANSFRAAIKKHRALYLGLAATWFVLVAVRISSAPSETMGFSIDITPIDYAMNQFPVIARYIKLSFWPARLCLYYSWPVIKVWRLIFPSLLTVAVILAVTFWGFIKNRVWSYPLVWFFAILVPSSSFVPIADLIFEHRVYLSLAGLVVIAVTSSYLLLGYLTGKHNLITNRLGLGIAIAVIVALTARTIYRNRDYQSALSIWQSVVKANPMSYKGYCNLGSEFKKQGRIDEAMICYQNSLRINPDYTNGRLGLANLLKSQNRLNEAADLYRRILLKDPNHVEANFNLGRVAHFRGNLDKAVGYYRTALEFKSDYADVHNNLGAALLSQGFFDEAVSHFNKSLQIKPDDAATLNNLAYALISRPNVQDVDSARAFDLARRSAELTGYKNPEVLETLAECYFKRGNTDLAEQTAQTALELALSANNKPLIELLHTRIKLYKERESSP